MNREERLNILKHLKNASEYKIKSGDSLWKISDGDPRFQKAILEANPEIDFQAIKPGQTIFIPEVKAPPNAGMDYDDNLVAFVKQEEALSLKPYVDSEGNTTIGYGRNLGRGTKASPITKEQALSYLKEDLDLAADFVRKNVDAKLNQGQFNALVSLAFNIGTQKLFGHKLFKLVDQGKFKQAFELIPNMVLSENSPGLKKRRIREAVMFGSLGGF